MSNVENFIQQGLKANQNGSLDDAIILFSQAIHLVPEHPLAHFFLGNVLSLKERYQEAIIHYEKSLEITPSNPLIYYNLGNAHKYLGNWQQSTEYYLKAIELHPDYHEAYLNLANVHRTLGQFDKAEELYLKTLEKVPDNIDVLNNLGLMHYIKKDYQKSVEYFDTILELEPQNALIYQNKAHVLMDMGQRKESMKVYQYSFELYPSLATINHMGLLHMQYGEVDSALNLFQQVIQQAGGAFNMYSPWLFSIHYLSNIKPDALQELHQSWGQLVEQHTPYQFNHLPQKDKKKIKIGYLSPDFRTHSAAFFLRPLLSNIPEPFEVVCYSDSQVIDSYTKDFQSLVKNWCFTSAFSNETLAQQIYEDEIDILIDPGVGHAGGNRLLVFALKPAPIQITFYPHTTGLAAIDYRITDQYLDPENEGGVETLQFMPHSMFCYSPPDPSPTPNSLPYHKNGFITFGSCQRLAKINNEVLELWSQILLKVPQSKLILKDRAFISPHTCQSILDNFNSKNISADRIKLKPYVNSLFEHLEFYHHIDISLDPFPFGGHMSTLESLWMGVPTITLKGSHQFGRVANAFQHILGLSQWCARSKDEYLNHALELTKDIETLSLLRDTLREKLLTSPLCNQKQYSQDIYQLFTKIWADYISQN